MKMPQTLKVGPYVYTVVGDPGMADDGDLGKVDLEGLRIVLDDSLAPTQVRSTLLHEVLHTCAFAVGIDGDVRLTQEDFIVRVEAMLLGVLRENPAFVTFVTAP